MNDNELKELFERFDPPMPADGKFMARLSAKLDTVEIIRRQQAQSKRWHRHCLAIAAAAGFCVGVVMTLLMSYIGRYAAGLSFHLPQVAFLDVIFSNYRLFAYVIVAITTIIISINTYDITLGLLSRRSVRP